MTHMCLMLLPLAPVLLVQNLGWLQHALHMTETHKLLHCSLFGKHMLVQL